MKALLVYPASPETFWSFRAALRFVSRKAAYPPLGLLTVAAMLPPDWDLRLVDLNIQGLTHDDLAWADLVMISAMESQSRSVAEVVERCRRAGVTTVAGGPLFTASPNRYPEVDHLVLGEAELTLAPFLSDLEAGCARHVYDTEAFCELEATPAPRWDLVRMRSYNSMNLQYSRGCPYDCEFCDITALFGRRPRTKSTDQVLAELDTIHARGWRGQVFFVDDNFIGKRKALKEYLLPALARWNRDHRDAFVFNTEASINLADDEELMDLMVKAGFDTVFVGIESPHEESLAECNKVQNRDRDLLDSVRRLHRRGLQVQGGFILGFDADPPNIFERQIQFIQQSGIVTAMVGLLSAPRLSRLHRRLSREGRIRDDWSGDNTDFTTNIIPRLPIDQLLDGYHRVLKGIYSHRSYYQRVRRFLREFQPPKGKRWRLTRYDLAAFFKSIWVLGIKEKGRRHYWALLAWTAARRPSLIPTAVTLAIYGYHFRTVFQQAL
jgi:radical SAM superfamily enzyme YgiQ (UPF0313 family)